MLGYSDLQGNFYVYDQDRTVHLEHHQIESAQFKTNSVAYLNSTGDLQFYSNHKLLDLEVTNPRFYMNTDHYLYYSIGPNYSLYNGKKKQHLGILSVGSDGQKNVFAFGDSIAAMHDFSNYFYAYWQDAFVELEALPVTQIAAGDNIIAYVDATGQTKIFYRKEKIVIDNTKAIAMQCGANTATIIDNYKYLKIFWNGDIFELYNIPAVWCSNYIGVFEVDADNYCTGEIIVSPDQVKPLFKTGDDVVAYMDDQEVFYIFYKGISNAYNSSVPKQFDVVDNIVWWIDDNNFFHVFYDGEDYTIESYTPKKIKADKNIIAYTDNYGKLKAFYKGETQQISSSIILDFELNNDLIMYSVIQNKYEFYKLKFS
ncbi:MAG: hypothetical protein H7X71_01075, partial [Chitinophagales bacterium]|nr:hypothetical protein [Chitinophagales bacterium]